MLIIELSSFGALNVGETGEVGVKVEEEITDKVEPDKEIESLLISENVEGSNVIGDVVWDWWGDVVDLISDSGLEETEEIQEEVSNME